MKTIFKNPYGNAVFAEVYIVAIVSLIHYFATPNTPDTFLDPVTAVSLFVLSAAVMGYLFLGQPLQLYLNNEKQQAVSFFFRTTITFAVITLIIVLSLKLGR